MQQATLRRVARAALTQVGAATSRRAVPSMASSVYTAAAAAAAPTARTAVASVASVAKASSLPANSRGFAASAGTIAEAASALEQQYARPLQALHWLIAGGTVGTFAFVQLAMNLPKEQAEDKGRFMMLHKSLGLTVLALSVPRLALRLTTKIPAAVPGSQIEQVAAKVGHLVMYGFMTAMPVSGFIMGYYGGKGLPFFGVTIPGASKRDGKLAGRAFKLHKQLGWYYEMFVPLHVGAVGVHALKGQNILRRMGVTAFG